MMRRALVKNPKAIHDKIEQIFIGGFERHLHPLEQYDDNVTRALGGMRGWFVGRLLLVELDPLNVIELD